MTDWSIANEPVTAWTVGGSLAVLLAVLGLVIAVLVRRARDLRDPEDWG